jgi:hypothetical protein
MSEDVRLQVAAAAIYRAVFTAAPIDFEEARRRDAFAYRRAMEAAEQVQAALAA